MKLKKQIALLFIFEQWSPSIDSTVSILSNISYPILYAHFNERREMEETHANKFNSPSAFSQKVPPLAGEAESATEQRRILNNRRADRRVRPKSVCNTKQIRANTSVRPYSTLTTYGNKPHTTIMTPVWAKPTPVSLPVFMIVV